MNIAITGSIGSGKSFVAKSLASLTGWELCDTDLVCKELLKKGNAGWKGVVAKWGRLYLKEDGVIDRPLLRAKIFSDEQIRCELETILHPFVRKHVQQLMLRVQSERLALIVEIPLLFEAGWQNDFDCVITVFANAEICLKRVMQRDGVSQDQVRKTLSSQMEIGKKVERSDHVIDNSGKKSQTMTQVETLSTHLSKKFISKNS